MFTKQPKLLLPGSVKKAYLAFIFAFLSIISLRAQDKKSELKLEKGEYPKETIHLQEEGFLILTDFLLSGKAKTGRLVYYNAKAERQWERSIENHYGQRATLMVTSPSKRTTYVLEIKGDAAGGTMGFNNKTHHIHQVTLDGQMEKMEIAGRKEFGKGLQAVFCDDDYLYYLVSENGWENHEKKKAGERLILNRFEHTSLKWEQFYFKLPPLKELNDASFWQFLGQTQNTKYLVAQRYNKKNGENYAIILPFNERAETADPISINFSLPGKYNRPAKAIALPRPPWKNIADMAFGESSMWTTYVGPGTGATSMRAQPGSPNTTTFGSTPLLPGAFGYWHLDSEHNYFYTYGLLGPKPFKIVGPVYDGFYVYRFDLKGDLIWQTFRKDVSELLENKQFKVHRKPYERRINLKVLTDETLNFSIHVPSTLFSYEITPKGEVKDVVIKEKERVSFNPILQHSSLQLKSEDYIKKQAKGNEKNSVSYNNFYSPGGEMLIKFDTKNTLLEILYFKL